MNNIDILEEYLDKQDRKYVSEYRLMILNAIETLIAENKELKEEKEKLGKLYYEASENCIKYENRIKKAIDYIGIDDDILETCGMVDVNGIELLKILKGWLDEQYRYIRRTSKQ